MSRWRVSLTLHARNKHSFSACWKWQAITTLQQCGCLNAKSLASDFALIHIEDRKRITRAESLSPDTILHPVNVDDPEEAYAVLSVGYNIHSGKPSARRFTEAASCDVHHRRLREGDNKQFALID